MIRFGARNRCTRAQSWGGYAAPAGREETKDDISGHVCVHVSFHSRATTTRASSRRSQPYVACSNSVGGEHCIAGGQGSRRPTLVRPRGARAWLEPRGACHIIPSSAARNISSRRRRQGSAAGVRPLSSDRTISRRQPPNGTFPMQGAM